MKTLLQKSLMSNGSRGRKLKPKLRKTVIFFKNIDLCATDKWGTCTIVELVIELIQRNGFYNDDLEWIGLSGFIVCCSMKYPPGRNISSRLQSITLSFYTEYPNGAELSLIVNNHFKPTAIQFGQSVPPNQITRIVEALIDAYNTIKIKFNQDISKHYVFTPKMLSLLAENLKYYPKNYFQQVRF